MTERKVYVLEARKKGSANLWRVRFTHWSRGEMCARMRLSRKHQPDNVFRIVVYKPTESTDR